MREREREREVECRDPDVAFFVFVHNVAPRTSRQLPWGRVSLPAAPFPPPHPPAYPPHPPPCPPFGLPQRNRLGSSSGPIGSSVFRTCTQQVLSISSSSVCWDAGDGEGTSTLPPPVVPAHPTPVAAAAATSVPLHLRPQAQWTTVCNVAALLALRVPGVTSAVVQMTTSPSSS